MGVLGLVSRLFLAALIAVIILPTAEGQSIFAFAAAADDQCPSRGCCEEDCCGEDTSWDAGVLHCINDPISNGFNGMYSKDYLPGCVDRVCCDAYCCGAGLKYDPAISYCVPVIPVTPSTETPPTTTPLTTPVVSPTTKTPTASPTMATPPVSAGPPAPGCESDNDCDIGICFKDPMLPPDLPGRCVCSVTTGEGCKDGFQCAGPGEIFDASGIIDAPPGCYLPDGATCSPDEFNCLSGNCDPTTLKCACSTLTNYPCDTDNGKTCVLEGESYVCTKAKGALGDDCQVDDDCETGECFFGFFPPGTPGTCACNLSTGAGCEEGFECASSDDIQDAQGIADAPQACFLPIGATCSPKEYLCLSGNCDPEILKCACNTFTNYPCDVENGETCALDSSSNSYVCQSSFAPATKPPGACPDIDEPCMNEENLLACTTLVEEGCKDILTLKSCPLQFQCGDQKYSSCGGIEATPCEDGYFCYTGISDDCDEDCGGRDCLGECRQVVPNERCGGFAGFECPTGTECVDEKGDRCSSNCGGADCMGICLVV